MASIDARRNKNGQITSYRIRVFKGRSADGKLIDPYTVHFKVDPKWTEEQALKKARKFANQFEYDCNAHRISSGKETFEEYSKYVMDFKFQTGALKYTTYSRYKTLAKRIYPEIGYMKMSEINARTLNSLFAKLSKTKVASKNTAIAKDKFFEVILSGDIGKGASQVILERPRTRISQEILAKAACVSNGTITNIFNKKAVEIELAEKIAKALDMPVDLLFEIKGKDKYLSSTTVKRYRELISSIMSQAEKEDIININPVRKTNPIKIKKVEADYYIPEEIVKIKEAFNTTGYPFKMFGYMLIFTGARLGEILGMEWHNIDSKKHGIKIEKNVQYIQERGVYVDTPKTETSKRYIPIPDQAWEVLMDYKEWYYKRRDMYQGYWTPKYDFVFCNDKGEPLNPGTFKTQLHRLQEKYSLPPLHPHAFRHTYGTNLAANNVDIVTVSKLLGHANVSTTANIYSHALEANKEKAAAELNKLF